MDKVHGLRSSLGLGTSSTDCLGAPPEEEMSPCTNPKLCGDFCNGKCQMGDWPILGTVIDDYIHRVDFEGRKVWEEHLRLHIKPKPSWMPLKLWSHLLTLILTQSVERL